MIMPLVSFLMYIFVTSFTPGPNNIMAMAFANKYGLKRTLKFCFGVSAGFLIIMLLSSYFNLMLKSVVPKIELIMTIVGALYMIYLAIKIMKSKDSSNNGGNEKENSFFMGMVLQFINPKGILYGITAIATFILPYHSSHGSLIFYSIVLAFVGFLSTFCWSLCGSIFQKFLSKHHRQFNIVMGLLLIYSAVSIVVH